jgi:hypothetical protein
MDGARSSISCVPDQLCFLTKADENTPESMGYTQSHHACKRSNLRTPPFRCLQSEPAYLLPCSLQKSRDQARNDKSDAGTGLLLGGFGGVGGSELYQSILRVKYIAAATATKLATAPTSRALSSRRSSR